MKKTIIQFVCGLLVLSSIGCSKKENTEESSSNAEITETDVEGLLPDFEGSFYTEDSSYIVINDDATAEISITGLAVFDGTVTAIEDHIATILCKDPNEEDVLFTYDRSSHTLTVQQTSWDYLEEMTSLTFDLDEMPESLVNEEDLKMYMGEHSSEDGSSIVFYDDGSVDINISDLGQIDAYILYTAGEICEITGIDENSYSYTFEYDHRVEMLIVTESTNDQIPVDTSYIFDVEN